MAARDTMAARAKPLLDDGERIDRVFSAAAGIHPLIGIAVSVAALFLMNAGIPLYYPLAGLAAGIVLLAQVDNLVVAVTDRAVVVMGAGMVFAMRPKQVILRLPVDTAVGPAQGALWKKVLGLSEAYGTPVRVHLRFVKDAVGTGG